MDVESKPVGGFHTIKRWKRYPREVMGQLVDPMLPRKVPRGATLVSVPQTDSGGRGENPQALERTLVKELGKLPP